MLVHVASSGWAWGRLIGPGSCYEPGPMSVFFLYLGFRVSLSPVPPLPLAGAPSPSRRCLRRLPLLRIADVLSIVSVRILYALLYTQYTLMHI